MLADFKKLKYIRILIHNFLPIPKTKFLDSTTSCFALKICCQHYLTYKIFYKILKSPRYVVDWSHSTILKETDVVKIIFCQRMTIFFCVL